MRIKDTLWMIVAIILSPIVLIALVILWMLETTSNTEL